MSAALQPRRSTIDTGEAQLCAFEWGTPGAQPSILLLHATGFHGRCWDRIVAAMPGRHIVAVEQRGHGRSSRPGAYDWADFSRDALAVVDALGAYQWLGCGHSMGGHVLALAAAQRPDAFNRLVLLDPVIMAPEVYGETTPWQALPGPEAHPVARRRNHFASVEDMVARFADRHPYSLWQPAVLEDYCRHGLVPAADGNGLELACPPVVEAAVYMGSTGHNVLAHLSDVVCPVTVARAKPRDRSSSEPMDFSASPTWPDLAMQFARGTDLYLPELSHFIPMQAPEMVAELLSI